VPRARRGRGRAPRAGARARAGHAGEQQRLARGVRARALCDEPDELRGGRARVVACGLRGRAAARASAALGREERDCEEPLALLALLREGRGVSD